MKPKIIIQSSAGVIRDVFANVDGLDVKVIDFDGYCAGSVANDKRIESLVEETKAMKKVYDIKKDRVDDIGIKKIEVVKGEAT